MSKRLIRGLQLGSGVIAIGLIASLFLTNPNDLGPFGITVWFILLLVVSTTVVTLLLFRLRKQRTTRAFTQSLRRGFLISIWAVSLLALNSLHQLTIADIILITVLVVVIDFYMRRMKA